MNLSYFIRKKKRLVYLTKDFLIWYKIILPVKYLFCMQKVYFVWEKVIPRLKLLFI